MKSFIVEYTLDCGETTHRERINADDYTKAYINVYAKLPKGADIIDLVEVKCDEEASNIGTNINL